MIQHKLTIMRKKETGSKDFRVLLKEIALLMGYEVTRDLPLEDVEIETPICKMTAKEVAGRKLAIVPILRAGLGMVEGLQSLVPVAKVSCSCALAYRRTRSEGTGGSAGRSFLSSQAFSRFLP